ncbi:MAG: YihY/virulence factor BrkB family protein [Bacteroidia bacterium]
MIRPTLRLIRKSAPARAVSNFSKRISLPGFEGLSLYEVATFFIHGINKGRLQTRAASMAYHFFMAIFPTIIFLFTLIPLIPVAGFQDMLFEAARDLMPETMFSGLEGTINGIIRRQNTGLLSFGFLAALYFSTSGINAMIAGFNSSIHVVERRTAWKQQLISLGLTLFFTFILLVVVGLLIYTELTMSEHIRRDGVLDFFIDLGRWVLMGLFLVFLLSSYYYIGPAQRMHRKFINPGSILAATLIVLTSLGFAWYVDNFGRYNKLYGSIGTIIVLLLWIYYNSMMLLVGFELNAGIEAARINKRSLLEQEEREASVVDEDEI